VNKNYRPTTGNREIAARNEKERNDVRKDYAASSTRPVSRGGNDQGTATNTRPMNNNKVRPVEKSRPSAALNKGAKERPAVVQNSQTRGRPAASQNSNTKGRPVVSQERTKKPSVNRQQNTSKPKASTSPQNRKSSSREAQKSGRG
jgi:hypothetical protein